MKRLVAALSLTLATPAAGQGVGDWSAHIAEASARFGMPREWIWRVIQAESGGRTSVGGRPVTSRAGAMGLMQLMPGTWAEMRRLHGLGSDPYAPRDNILAGTAYLRTMYDQFGFPGLFAAYNAGPNRYAQHLATGDALPAETVAYLRKLSTGPGVAAVPEPSFRSSPAPGTATSIPWLFVVRHAVPQSAGTQSTSDDGLFAIRAAPRD